MSTSDSCISKGYTRLVPLEKVTHTFSRKVCVPILPPVERQELSVSNGRS